MTEPTLKKISIIERTPNAGALQVTFSNGTECAVEIHADMTPYQLALKLIKLARVVHPAPLTKHLQSGYGLMGKDGVWHEFETFEQFLDFIQKQESGFMTDETA